MHRQYRITYTYLFIFFIFTFLFCCVKHTNALTIFYSGEEHGQLGPHGCGVEQVGGLANRYTLIENLYIKHPGAVLNLHTGNLIDASDPNSEWVYQIGLSALEMLKVDVFCLGHQELSLPEETVSSLHASYPSIRITCGNLEYDSVSRYLIESTDSNSVAVINLLSQIHAKSLTNVSLISPESALSTLQSELVDKVDVIVVVFHGTDEEASLLTQRFPWIDVLIVADNKERDRTGIHSPGTFTGQTGTVSNVSSGAAVGVLEMAPAKELQHYIFTNGYHGVSENIEPNEELAQLITAYESSIASSDSFDIQPLDIPANAIYLTYFHQQGCQKCVRAVNLLKTLQEKYPQVVIEHRNAKAEQSLLEAMGILYDVSETKRMTTPAIFIGDAALIDELNEQHLENTVQRYIETGVASRIQEAEAELGAAESEIVDRFHGFGLLTVAGAGLLDGINPCAFATIVFFISYMTLVGRKKKEMLIAGGAFTLAVFTTYFLLGLGTLSVMNYLNRFSGVATCVYLIAALLTFGLAGLSLYDAVKAKQGKTKEVLLQLPRVLKQRIHKVIREQTRTSGVIIGAIVIGFVISALELVCTGQVYLPTLTFVAGVEGMRANAIAYLLLYNLMFIVPLLIVFGCVYWGTTSVQLGGVLQRHLVTVKVAIGLLLFGLGTWLVLIII